MNNKDYQEALTNLKTYIVDYDDEYDEDIYLYESYKEEFDLLQELVDKATPKKPIKIKTNYMEAYVCPNCRHSFEGFSYCRFCGQKLDRSNEVGE